jgi:hypothetical protein
MAFVLHVEHQETAKRGELWQYRLAAPSTSARKASERSVKTGTEQTHAYPGRVSTGMSHLGFRIRHNRPERFGQVG